MPEDRNESNLPENEEWVPSVPDELPALTFWPIVLSLGIVFLWWGFITSLIISGVGVVAMAVALFGWIEEFRDE